MPSGEPSAAEGTFAVSWPSQTAELGSAQVSACPPPPRPACPHLWGYSMDEEARGGPGHLGLEGEDGALSQEAPGQGQ